MINFIKLQSTWRIRCRKTGLKQKEIAERLDMTPARLCALCNLRIAPGTKAINNIEDFLAEHGQPFKAEYIAEGNGDDN